MSDSPKMQRLRRRAQKHELRICKLPKDAGYNGHCLISISPGTANCVVSPLNMTLEEIEFWLDDLDSELKKEP